MAIRFAAASALALAAALLVAPAARAQSFSFYEMSPRQIVGMLEDDGYQLRGPMLRRGRVYVCDVVSVSGRSARLIVDARDGNILERYDRSPRWRYANQDDRPRVLRPPRDVGDDDQDSDRRQTAFGDLFGPPSRVYGGDIFSSKPEPEPEAAPHPKPKHHVAKRHKAPSYAKEAPAASPSPDAAASTPEGNPSSSVAAVAPTAAPEPKKPAEDAVKPEAAPKIEAAPKPVASPAPTKAAETEKRPTAAPAPPAAPKTAHKKLNDLPVGTLD